MRPLAVVLPILLALCTGGNVALASEVYTVEDDYWDPDGKVVKDESGRTVGEIDRDAYDEDQYRYEGDEIDGDASIQDNEYPRQ